MSNAPELPLDQLRRKRARWLECLAGDDLNSILQQLYMMVWDTAAFWTIVEARRLATRDEHGMRMVNGMLHGLLDRTFFDSQAMSIRRLADDGYSIDHAERGTNSLGNLIKDLRKHSALFTRENMLVVERLDRPAEGTPFDVHDAEDRNVQIDELAGVDKAARSPTDIVRTGVFDFLADRVATVAREIRGYVDKFLAHAATPANRALTNVDNLSITFRHLRDAVQEYCEIAGFISIHVLGGPQRGFLPHTRGDDLQFLDAPLAARDTLSVLAERWRAFEAETHLWGQRTLGQLGGATGQLGTTT